MTNNWDECFAKVESKYRNKYATLPTIEKEIDVLKKVIVELAAQLENDFSFQDVAGLGGSGIVLKIKDIHLDIDRALKLPRPDPEMVATALNEIQQLSQLRHENIVAVHHIQELTIVSTITKYPYFIMDYVRDAMTLRESIEKYTIKAKEEIEAGKDSTTQCRRIVDAAARLITMSANAIRFLHSNNIIHFDIKPTNILVDENGKALLSDLGFAKCKNDSEEVVSVGFTLAYAHNDLGHEYSDMPSKNRVHKMLAPSTFRKEWDIFAFGKSILEILSVIDRCFPDLVVYERTFGCLHLAACRMLDGFNQTDTVIENIRRSQQQTELSAYFETWMNMGSEEMKSIRYSDMQEVFTDLEKLMHHRGLDTTIPELSLAFNRRIQCSEGVPAPFTQRVKRIVEHPVFSRLAYVTQLGLVNTIYPTATHTRLEHSLGVFRNCCLYVNALLADEYSPLFQQLMSEDDIKLILLVSLLHDIGQYPLAHDIQGAINAPRHESHTADWLRNKTPDSNGATLADIVQNQDWGWGVNVERLINFFESSESKRSIRDKILHGIIDGPLDVDKLDYLLRDSQRCYLRYGDMIDVDRLIRSLTIVVTSSSRGVVEFDIGTYEKGQSAAEALTFARYLLYQVLYWHHTSRSIRTMLRPALAAISRPPKKKGGRSDAILRSLADDNAAYVNELIEELIGVKDKPKSITTDDILHMINANTNNEGKALIELVQNRRYYKRLVTIHHSKANVEGGRSQCDSFRECAKKRGFESALQNEILRRYTDFINQTKQPRVSLLAIPVADKVQTMLKVQNMILCDAPRGSYGTERMLRFIPEPQRLQKNFKARLNASERVSEVWQQVHFNLMNIASKGRVFCHPEIRDGVMAALGPDVIMDAVAEVLKKFDGIDG